jgi:sugar/nucleoside kinase (ribokinase family)
LLDIVVMGHFAIDRVEINGKALPPSLGGTVAFSSLAAAMLGSKVGIVSKVGPDFRDDNLLIFTRSGIDVSGVKKVSTPTTKYRLQYIGEERNLTLVSRCDPIRAEDVKQLSGKVRAVHLGPIAGEIPLETLKEVGEWNCIVLLDLQGIVRKFDKLGGVSLEKNEQLPEMVKCATIVKSALREGEAVMGVSGFKKVASSLLGMGCKIVIVTLGGNGSYISTFDGESLSIPVIKPRKVTDFTGAGDVYAGSFLTEYLKTKDVRRSGIIAGSTVSFKVEGHSTAGFASREKIEERAKQYLEV